MGEHFEPALVDGEVVHAGFFRPIQQLLSDYASPNFRLYRVDGTTVGVDAVTGGDEQVAIAIPDPADDQWSRWRYITADITAAIPGGDATRDIYVTASDNDFSGPTNDPDQTDYSFALSVRASGSPPATALYRLVGTCVVVNGIIESIAQTVGRVTSAMVEAGIPAGTLQDFAGSSVPTGYLPCDGTVRNRADYPALFGAISTLWNTGGEAGTEFRLPDLRGRIAVGAGTHSEVDTVGETDGVAVGSRKPSHTHADGSLAVASHTHSDGSLAVASHTHSFGTLAVAAHSHDDGDLVVASHTHSAGSLAAVNHAHNPGKTLEVTPSSTSDLFVWSGAVSSDGATADVNGSTGSAVPTVNGDTGDTAPAVSGATASASPDVSGATGSASPDVTGATDSAGPSYGVVTKIIKT